MAQLNKKIDKNMAAMATVIERDNKTNDTLTSHTKTLHDLSEQFQLVIQCLPENIRLNYQNSKKDMELDEQQE